LSDFNTASITVPVHLGVILDGNRRWAQEQGLPNIEGHKRGYANLHKNVKRAADRGVKYISAYVFSTENWDRTAEEVGYLMDLFVWAASNDIERYVRDGFKIVFLGSKKRLSDKVLRAMDYAEAKSRHNTRAVLAYCMNYGGHTELAEGVARLIEDGIPASEVTTSKLAEYLYHPEIPALDFIIRFSGEQRLSGFMMWRSEYAELYFTSKHWPTFTEEDLDTALLEYSNRKRRFGK
jgi:undecaprenyl diphosphate synthase